MGGAYPSGLRTPPSFRGWLPARRPLAAAVRRRANAALLCIALAGIPGCNVGGKGTLSKQNDALRRERLELKDRITSLESQLAEANAKIAESQRAIASPLPADVVAAMPRVASVEIDTFTGFTPTDPAAPIESIAVYVRPLDGLRRFTQGVGTLAVEATVLGPIDTSNAPAGSAPSERELSGAGAERLTRLLSPAEVRDAYRSGLTGTHYEVQLPLARPATDRARRVLVRVEFTDAITGEVFRVERLTRALSPARTASPNASAGGGSLQAERPRE